jgi:hypothetical protein
MGRQTGRCGHVGLSPLLACQTTPPASPRSGRRADACTASASPASFPKARRRNPRPAPGPPLIALVVHPPQNTRLACTRYEIPPGPAAPVTYAPLVTRWPPRSTAASAVSPWSTKAPGAQPALRPILATVVPARCPRTADLEPPLVRAWAF